MNLLVLTSIVSVAPLPNVLPAYEVECAAGAMTSLDVVHMDVTVEYADGERRGTVRTLDGSFPAKIEARPIALESSIGGTGFVDVIEYESAGRRTEAWLSVRGSINDNLVGFWISSRENERGVRESTLFRGQCHLKADQNLGVGQ